MTEKSIGGMNTMASDPGKDRAYTLRSGQTLGQYRIIRTLGKGGMGEVYEAEHGTLELRYALKLLPSDFASQPGALERFKREAKVMAQLQHPNIVKVDEFGEVDGRYWLRMELAEGVQSGDGKQVVSLQDLADAGGGKIDQATLADILKQILEGLSYTHARGAVHRDLKPSNILFSGGVAKIADFGLVRLVGEDWVRSQAQLSVQRSMSIGVEKTMQAGSEPGSSTRSMLGTFEYMSPEQKRGEDATPQSDLYAVGLMAFKLLTGQNPGLKPPSRIDRGLDKAWDDLLERALEESPQDRWSSAGEMLAGLNEISASYEDAERERQAEAAQRQRAEAERQRKQEEARRQKAEAERLEAERRQQYEAEAQAQPPVPVTRRKSRAGRWVVAALLALGVGL